MNGFLVGLIIAAIKALLKDKEFTDWVDVRLSAVEANIKQDLIDMGTGIQQTITALPEKIIGDAEHDVKSLLGPLPDQFKGQVSPLFETFFNPADMAKSIVGAMTGQGGQKPPWWPF